MTDDERGDPVTYMGIRIDALPDLLAALERIKAWLWVDLIDPHKPLSRDSAAKALNDIIFVINKARGGS